MLTWPKLTRPLHHLASWTGVSTRLANRLPFLRIIIFHAVGWNYNPAELELACNLCRDSVTDACASFIRSRSHDPHQPSLISVTEAPWLAWWLLRPPLDQTLHHGR
jgi:hypothetical protein